MESSKRLIIAIALSVVVWFLYMNFLAPKKPEKKDIAGVETSAENSSAADKNAVTEKKTGTGAEVSEPAASINVVSSKIPESVIGITTDKYTVSLSNKGAVIKNFVYKYNGRDIELTVPYKPRNTEGTFDFAVHFSENEFLRGNSLQDTVWNFEKKSESNVMFFTNLSLNGRDVQLQKTYKFLKDANYFEVEYSLVNPGKEPVVLPNGNFIVSPGNFLGPEMDFENSYNTLGQIYYMNGDFEKPGKGGGFFSKGGATTRESGDVKWAGVMSRYFLLIMLANDSGGNAVITDARGDSAYRTGLFIPAEPVQPGGKFTKSFKVYAGEKNKEKLAAVDASLKDAADVSKWIEPIRDVLMWCLLKINILFGNFGWSLVVFSILTKIILLPLTQKSTESMRRMQALSPQMNELKAKYKDKPDQLNKEMMKLYKANKVNPMGGCLPMLVQMPFFFALYSALINSIDLWQAPFIFWIKDLSMPDTVATISGFNLNILPLLMTGATFLQQKMTPGSQTGQQQKMMMMMMPLIFIFIFWSMPSGLVLYWTLQNLIQVLHQVIVNRRPEKVKN
ncbi:MAG: membrane protein insertase YidC [Spirochaetes bacterium]|nr:membrane protein insertase YidC [Spirochaetota bacterium]